MEDIKGLFNYEYMINVINGDSVYPGGILGAHLTDRGFVVTVYNPRAAEVAVIEKRSSHKCSISGLRFYHALLLRDYPL